MLLIHPRGGGIADVEDDDGEGTMVGCTVVVEDVAEDCLTVDPLMFFLATLLAGLVAAVCLCVAAATVGTFEAAASALRASRASLCLCLQLKHVRRGFIVPFLICSCKNLSYCPE